MKKRNDYIVNNLVLAKNVAYKMKGKHGGADFDDILGYANLGLILAADTYDASRGSSFQTYAYKCICGAVVDGLRHDKVIVRIRRKTQMPSTQNGNISSPMSVQSALTPWDDVYLKPDHVSLRNTVSFDAGEGIDVGHAEAEEVVENKIDREKKRRVLKRALAALPCKMKGLLIKHYFHNMSLKEAGASLKLSKSWASRLHDRALVRLAQELQQHACVSSSAMI